jgi:hypothetical protein
MSEDNRGNGADHSAISLAERMYPGGPIGGGPADPRTREAIEAGIARPDPRFVDERAPEGGGPSFDAARYRAPNGAEYDHGMMGEFSSAARELGISQQAGERLLEMHHKAMTAQTAALERQWNDWYAQTQRHYGDRLPEIVHDIKAAIGSDPDAAEFYRLLEWSGMAYSPQVLRVLHRLAGGGRRW